MKFRYWLNAKGVKERVGVNTMVSQVPLDAIDFKSLLPKATAKNKNQNAPQQKSPELGRRPG